MNKFVSMKFFRCFAWMAVGCWAMDVSLGVRSFVLVVLGAYSASLGFVLLGVFEDDARKVKK